MPICSCSWNIKHSYFVWNDSSFYHPHSLTYLEWRRCALCHSGNTLLVVLCILHPGPHNLGIRNKDCFVLWWLLTLNFICFSLVTTIAHRLIVRQLVSATSWSWFNVIFGDHYFLSCFRVNAVKIEMKAVGIITMATLQCEIRRFESATDTSGPFFGIELVAVGSHRNRYSSYLSSL